MSLNEDLLCRAFAEKIRHSAEFLAWVLGQTKFSAHQSNARLLYEAQVRSRPRVQPNNWWRHWWCKIPGSGKEGETDIFLAFEDVDTKMRFVLHIENKKDSEFLDGQPEGYETRARLKINDPRWLNYVDFETVLIAPIAYRATRRPSCDVFERFISYESIASFVPEFLLQAHEESPVSIQLRSAEERQETLAVTVPSMPWKQDVDWSGRVERVLRYYRLRRDLKFGSRKSFPVINFLCERKSATQDELMHNFSLTKDDIATILANVTIALQGKGSVWSPASGGWYMTTPKPHTYTVAPGFVAAWEEQAASQRPR